MKINSSYSSYPFLCSWSGGKDSYLACLKAKSLGHQPKVLLNNLNERGQISRSHAIPKDVLIEQAKTMNLPIEFNITTWENYETSFIKKLKNIKNRFRIEAAVFGDIDIESHRTWEEKVSIAAKLKPILPIWQGKRIELVQEMLSLGMKCLIVSCQVKYAEAILGKIIDERLIDVFEELDIDVCGENGEYHTIVLDGPLQQSPLEVAFNGYRSHDSYAFLNFS